MFQSRNRIESDCILSSSQASFEDLEYNPATSYLVSFAINYQNPHTSTLESLNNPVVGAALKVRSAFQEKNIVPNDNANLFYYKPDVAADAVACTFERIRNTFRTYAQLVGKDGIFIFHFSGHSSAIGGQFRLVPQDYSTKNQGTWITARVLLGWLNECRAKYVVFSLDCCGADGISAELTKHAAECVPLKLYVISACMASEKTMACDALECTIFSYFFSHSIQEKMVRSNIFPISGIFTLCAELSGALSSLLVKFDDGNLQSRETHGNLRRIWSLGQVATPFEDPESRPGIMHLSRESSGWIVRMCQEQGGLHRLNAAGVLRGNQRLINTALCFMLYSVASCQKRYDPQNVDNRSIYFKAFDLCSSKISRITQSARIDRNSPLFYRGLMYYLSSLQHSGVVRAPVLVSLLRNQQ